MSDSDGAARARPRQVGVREVAAAAGVSTQTVSRVMNGHAYIREETRQRVLSAMEALDYRVNNAARALGTQQSKTIGIIASDASLYGPSAGIAALEAASREADRWVVTAFADGDDEASVIEAVDHVQGQGVDGIILVAPHERTLTAVEGRLRGEPIAVLHGGAGAAAQRLGAATTVAHLVELGHTRIGRLGGPPAWLEEVSREIGFRQALSEYGLEPASLWSGDWSAASGAAVADNVAAAVRDGSITAVVVGNDQMALGLIAGLRSTGIDVPAEVSVTGFDDNPDAGFYRPPLTTVRLDLLGEARRCIAEILSAAEGTTRSPEHALPTDSDPRLVSPATEPALVARASTGPPATR